MIMHFAVNAFNVFATYMAGASIQPEQETDALALLTEGLSSPLYVILSVCGLAAVAGMLILIIYRAFKINGRTLRTETADTGPQDKRHPADLFLLVYIVAAVILTIQGTVFR